MTFKELTFREQQEYLNTLPDSKIEEAYDKMNSWWKKVYKDDSLITYDEYKRNYPKYAGDKCFFGSCVKPAVYREGDVRYYAGFCEEHSWVRCNYLRTLQRYPAKLSKKSFEIKKYNLG